MHHRTLGRTGLSVSEIGFGAWGLGRRQWIGAEDSESIVALSRAADLGINFIDTALAYGEGHSERLVGRLVQTRREPLHVATKVPPKNMTWPAARHTPVDEVFPADHVVRCTETSLKNLGLETIDLLQLHVWTDEFASQGDWLAAVEKLKEQGKIRHFGISLGEHTPENGIRAVEAGLVDTVQVIYNIFDQGPEDRLFEACRKRNVGVIARVPLDEGGLTGKVTPDTRFPEGDFRNQYFRGERRREVFERVQRIAADAGVPLDGMTDLALRFALSHPAVSTVVVGMRSVAHVTANAAARDGRGLSPDVLKKLRAHRWPRNFYTP